SRSQRWPFTNVLLSSYFICQRSSWPPSATSTSTAVVGVVDSRRHRPAKPPRPALEPLAPGTFMVTELSPESRKLPLGQRCSTRWLAIPPPPPPDRYEEK